MAHLVFDLLILGVILFCGARLSPAASPAAAFLKAGLTGITLIGAWGTLLGYLGLLYPFVLTAGLLLSAFAASRLLLRKDPDAFGRRPTSEEWRALCGIAGVRAQWTRTDMATASLIGVFLALQLAAALGHTPAIYDSLSYRLTRIALWLQEGSLWQTDVLDTRINFMPTLVDLQMLWVTGHWFEGYPGTALPQWWGGCMLLAATHALARAEGATRLTGLFAAVLVAGMPLAAVQFSTDQTDLLTAGIFAAGLALFRAGLNSGRLDPWAGLAFGLSFAAKPSVVFTFPGLLLWAAWLWWRKGRPAASLTPFLAASGAAALLLAAPRLVENKVRYGSWLSSPQVAAIYLSPAPSLAGLATNLRTSALQALTPGPCPEPLRAAVVDFVRRQAESLPVNDADQVHFEPRAARVVEVCGETHYDADVAPPGPAILLGALVGLLIAAFGTKDMAPARRAAVWGGFAAFALFCTAFLLLNRWHPYWFRFLSLPAPWLAVSIALAMDRSGPAIQAIRSLIGLVSLVTALLSWSHCWQSGWQNLFLGDNQETRVWTMLSRQVVERLERMRPGPVTLMLPFNFKLAGFFRTASAEKVRLAPEAALADPATTPQSLAGEKETGWVLTQADRFAGKLPGGPVHGAGLGHPRFRDRDLALHLVSPDIIAPGTWIRHLSAGFSPGNASLSLEVAFVRDGPEAFTVLNTNPFPVRVLGLPGGVTAVLPPGGTLSSALEGRSGLDSSLEIRFSPEGGTAAPAVPAAPVVNFERLHPFILPDRG